MPKLTSNVASKAEAAADSWGDRRPLEPGEYIGRLVKVTVRDGKEAAQWVWEFDVLGTNNKVWDSTSLSEKAIGRLGKVFAAFGVSSDTDTDELVNQFVGLSVGVRTIQDGERKGQIANTVVSHYPACEHPRFAELVNGDGAVIKASAGTAPAVSLDEYGLAD